MDFDCSQLYRLISDINFDQLTLWATVLPFEYDLIEDNYLPPPFPPLHTYTHLGLLYMGKGKCGRAKYSPEFCLGILRWGRRRLNSQSDNLVKIHDKFFVLRS